MAPSPAVADSANIRSIALSHPPYPNIDRVARPTSNSSAPNDHPTPTRPVSAWKLIRTSRPSEKSMTPQPSLKRRRGKFPIKLAITTPRTPSSLHSVNPDIYHQQSFVTNITPRIVLSRLFRRFGSPCTIHEVALCYLDRTEETVKDPRDRLKLAITFGTGCHGGRESLRWGNEEPGGTIKVESG